ncbi:MAG: polysaccharide biosynthesis protein GumN [Sphingomonas bacterium]|uniref:TraB/GumN family protein n=1 Tax=Sphingomonas bacterium TaxID=1895847 RepID=UPI00261C8540|nr:TraB/GumN family protein [Sphingomonas bacterium]MDB5695309.1 polysaccharide biosynthesis protein GumN [Sphingomonas bacterium]
MLKHLLTACALLAMTPACAQRAPSAARAAPDADPALWVVRDADTTLYLLGTIHVLKPGMTWFDEAVRTAFDRSDELKLEIVEPDAATMGGLIQAKGMSPAGPTLTQRLPAKARPALAKYMGVIGLPQAGYDRMQPWLAATFLQVQSLVKVGYDPASGPEKILAEAAKASGKPVTGLETVEQQIGFFSGLSDKAQVAMLDDTLGEMPTLQRTMGRMVDEWGAGRTDYLARELNDGLTKSPEAMKVLLTDRNARWAEWIKGRLAQPGTVFIAVGAGHLAGKGSVQEALAKRGVKTVRVKY